MKIKKILAFLFVCSVMICSVLAVDTASSSWGVTTYYAPTSGTLYTRYLSNAAQTRLTFSFDNASNLFKINTENNKGNYTGMDIKSVGKNASTGKECSGLFNAYTITSTLPDCKTDLESNWGQKYQDESEAVALGTLEQGKEYAMSVYWDDYRDGTIKGSWVVNCELSTKGFSDYNVVDYRWCTSLEYGATKGQK